MSKAADPDRSPEPAQDESSTQSNRRSGTHTQPPQTPSKAAEADTSKVDPGFEFWMTFRKAAQDATELRPKLAREMLVQELAKHPIAATYNLLLLYDDMSLVRADADAIYEAIAEFREAKPILLVLFSPGGDIEPAYLIGKLCREHAEERFAVVVPRRAKSAATLVCCAADELHMGSLSELGPLDPQIGRHPALGLGNAIRHIAELAAQYPAASSMFAEYLARSVRPIDLGYFERVVESAVQYAERLLNTHETALLRKPSAIASTLVYSYKDHGFVIDRQEAAQIFGPGVVKSDTEEYRLGNGIYSVLSFIQFVCERHDHKFYWIGGIDTDCRILRSGQTTS